MLDCLTRHPPCPASGRGSRPRVGHGLRAGPGPPGRSRPRRGPRPPPRRRRSGSAGAAAGSAAPRGRDGSGPAPGHICTPCTGLAGPRWRRSAASSSRSEGRSRSSGRGAARRGWRTHSPTRCRPRAVRSLVRRRAANTECEASRGSGGPKANVQELGQTAAFDGIGHQHRAAAQGEPLRLLGGVERGEDPHLRGVFLGAVSQGGEIRPAAAPGRRRPGTREPEASPRPGRPCVRPGAPIGRAEPGSARASALRAARGGPGARPPGRPAPAPAVASLRADARPRCRRSATPARPRPRSTAPRGSPRAR